MIYFCDAVITPRRPSKARYFGRVSNYQEVRSPFPSLVRERAPRPIRNDPVVPFVLPIDSGWVPPRGKNVCEISFDAAFHARYRSDQNTLPIQERDHRFRRTTCPVVKPHLTDAEYIGR